MEATGPAPHRAERPGGVAGRSGLRWVEGMLAEHMAELQIPGAAVTIVRHGEIEGVVCLGALEREGGVPVTPRTPLAVGPLSRTIAAVGLMRLAEEGRVGLDDLVADHLPAGRVRAELEDPRMTIRHLLTDAPVNAGTPRRFRPGLGRRPVPAASPLLPRSVRLSEPPGGAPWEQGLATVAEVVTAVTGASFARYMSEDVLEPLNMFSTVFRAAGHPTTEVRPALLRPRTSPPDRPGEAISTPVDLGHFVAALVSPGARNRAAVIGDETLELMLSPSAPLPAWGLGFWLDHLDGHIIARAGTAAVAPTALCCFAPEDGAGVALALHLEDVPDDALPCPTQLATDILSRLLGVKATSAVP